MTQENLKLLAEDIGKQGVHIDTYGSNNSVVFCRDPSVPKAFWCYVDYTPATNPAQAEELQIHYKMGVCPYIDSDLWEAVPMDFPLTCKGVGKTPGEAVTNCALEIIKSKQ